MSRSNTNRTHRKRARASVAEARAVGASGFVGALLLLMVGCSGGDGPTDPPPSGDAVEIEIVNFSFAMEEVHVEPGTTVRWRNTTSTFHTVTPDGHDAFSQWETSAQGETFEVTFDEPGTYPYHCVPHQGLGMMGTVIVE